MPLAQTVPAVSPRAQGPRPALAFGLIVLAALLVGAAHVAANYFTPYGFHRDEFLYLAMGRHLRLWAMDFPPMMALMARATRQLLGDSLPAIRALPAVAHVLLVLMAGVLAREFGGGRFAQVLAALSVALAPLFMRPGALFHPVVFDQLWWTLALLALARLGRTSEASGDTGDPFAWLGLGIVAGLGLLTKFSIGFLGVGMLVGLILSRQRRALATWSPYQALVVALAIGSPSIVGQARLGFPVVPQMQNLEATQLTHVGYLDYLFGQVLFLGPIAILVILGALRLLFAPSARAYRAVGWTCVATFVLLMVLHGKAYYIGPIYPTLIAAGAAALELGTAGLARNAFGRAAAYGLRGIVVVLVLAYGLGSIPMGLPILHPRIMADYSADLGITAAVTTNHGAVLRLPQDYADMLGWRHEVAAVARAFKGLPPAQQAEAVVSGRNYGQAGAIDYWGPGMGLPPAISPAGSYWFFGPGRKPGNVLVTIGWDSTTLARYYRVVRPVLRVTNPWGVPEEQDLLVIVSEQPLEPLQQVWPSLANWY